MWVGEEMALLTLGDRLSLPWDAERDWFAVDEVARLYNLLHLVPRVIMEDKGHGVCFARGVFPSATGP